MDGWVEGDETAHSTTARTTKIPSPHSQLVTMTLRTLFLLSCSLGWTSVVLTQESPAILNFEGTLVNELGSALGEAHVQFWHTDTDGNYDHPDFPIPADQKLNPSFQYFGTATTDVNGTFVFRTHRPGVYSQRPISHIHYRVWSPDQQNLWLTSQFYFRDEGRTEFSDLQQLDLIAREGTVNEFDTVKRVVIDQNLPNSDVQVLEATPSDIAGPYYPVVDFFEIDNDLITVTQREAELLQAPKKNEPTPGDTPTSSSSRSVPSDSHLFSFAMMALILSGLQALL